METPKREITGDSLKLTACHYLNIKTKLKIYPSRRCSDASKHFVVGFSHRETLCQESPASSKVHVTINRRCRWRRPRGIHIPEWNNANLTVQGYVRNHIESPTIHYSYTRTIPTTLLGYSD